jgi:hypothetical protein
MWLGGANIGALLVKVPLVHANGGWWVSVHLSGGEARPSCKVANWPASMALHQVESKGEKRVA